MANPTASVQVLIQGPDLPGIAFAYLASSSVQQLNLGFVPSFAYAGCNSGTAAWCWYSGLSANFAVSMSSITQPVTSSGIATNDGSAGTGIGLTLGTAISIQDAGLNIWRGYALR